MVTTPSFTGTCDKEFALTGTTFLQAQRGELITIKGTSVFFPINLAQEGHQVFKTFKSLNKFISNLVDAREKFGKRKRRVKVVQDAVSLFNALQISHALSH